MGKLNKHTILIHHSEAALCFISIIIIAFLH